MELYVRAVWDSKRKPSELIIAQNESKKTNIILYKPKSGLQINTILSHEKIIADLLTKCLNNGTLVIDGFKRFLDHFNPDIPNKILDVYDTPLSDCSSSLDVTDLLNSKKDDWQKLLANASVIYNRMEKRGVILSYKKVYPKWSVDTFSGRSKTTEVNIQGISDLPVQNVFGDYDDCFIHFDWLAADVRIAAILSKDEELLRAASQIDPYQYIADKIGGVDRSMCKQTLLQSINSMNVSSAILDMFPKLKSWITESSEKLNANEPLLSILGRPFTQIDGKTQRSPFNATMQGSIAHAMHSVLPKVWDIVGPRLLAEVHDSIIVSIKKSAIKECIQKVTDEMIRPFKGVIDNDLILPVKVSVGTKWRNWKQIGVYT